MINIGIDAKQFANAQKLLEKFPEQVNIAAAVSINRTLTTVKKETSVAIRKNYVIKAGDIKSSMTHKRADRRTLRGLIKTVGKPLPLEKFKLSSSGNAKIQFKKFSQGKTAKKRSPIGVQVLKGRGLRAPRRGGLFRLPIMSRMSRRYGGLLYRKTKARYPIKSPAGPSIPQMFGAERTLEQLEPLAQKTLDERFQHEIEHRMGARGV